MQPPVMTGWHNECVGPRLVPTRTELSTVPPKGVSTQQLHVRESSHTA